MLKFLQAVIDRCSPLQMPGDIAISNAIAELTQSDTRFHDRLERALLIIESDQHIFGKYSGYATEHFDRAAALSRLVRDATIHSKNLKDGLLLQVEEVITTGRRYADKRDVEQACKSFGWLIGLER